MPNKPRAENPAHPVRFEDDLWTRVKMVAGRLGKTPSEIVRMAVREFLERIGA